MDTFSFFWSISPKARPEPVRAAAVLAEPQGAPTLPGFIAKAPAKPKVK
jgi:hypothetical protein